MARLQGAGPCHPGENASDSKAASHSTPAHLIGGWLLPPYSSELSCTKSRSTILDEEQDQTCTVHECAVSEPFILATNSALEALEALEACSQSVQKGCRHHTPFPRTAVLYYARIQEPLPPTSFACRPLPRPARRHSLLSSDSVDKGSKAS